MCCVALPYCLFVLACFFLPSFSSLIKACTHTHLKSHSLTHSHTQIISAEIAELQRARAVTSAKMEEYKRKLVDLGHRVLQVCVRQLIFLTTLSVLCCFALLFASRFYDIYNGTDNDMYCHSVSRAVLSTRIGLISSAMNTNNIC